jgi:hypothetical protein
VQANVDASVRSLTRLAQLLQRRYGGASSRSFVMLIADLRRVRARGTDDLATQPIRTFL